ncbi:MAG: hypothetical protein AVDCRST_MAG59-339, partial [uncultured Thermomicrobiales bacterium]
APQGPRPDDLVPRAAGAHPGGQPGARRRVRGGGRGREGRPRLPARDLHRGRAGAGRSPRRRAGPRADLRRPGHPRRRARRLGRRPVLRPHRSRRGREQRGGDRPRGQAGRPLRQGPPDDRRVRGARDRPRRGSRGGRRRDRLRPPRAGDLLRHRVAGALGAPEGRRRRAGRLAIGLRRRLPAASLRLDPRLLRRLVGPDRARQGDRAYRTGADRDEPLAPARGGDDRPRAGAVPHRRPDRQALRPAAGVRPPGHRRGADRGARLHAGEQRPGLAGRPPQGALRPGEFPRLPCPRRRRPGSASRPPHGPGATGGGRL